MSSYAENVITPNNRLVSTVDSIHRDCGSSTTDYMNFYNSISGTSSTTTSGYPGTIHPETRSGVVPTSSSSDKNPMEKYEKHPDSSDKSSGRRETPAMYTNESLPDSTEHSILSWDKCSTDLHTLNRINPGPNMRTPLLSEQQNDDFSYHIGAVTGFFNKSSSPIDGNNVNNSVDHMFSNEGPNSSWCNVSWAGPNLGPSGDRNGVPWAKSDQNPITDANSFFDRPGTERSWRNRTSSDGGGVPSQKSGSVSNRAGQCTSETSTSNARSNHRRKGRTGSASDNSSVVGSPSLTADEDRSTNLPPGQGVNADDFGMAINLADRVARMSYAVEASSLQRPLNPSESSSSVLGQTLSTMEKPHLLGHQTQSNFWSGTSMLPKGVAPSNVDPLVYNQKTDAYHRSGTSDQFTQHDALGAFRCDVGVYSKPVDSFSYGDDDSLEHGQQPVGNFSDDRLWFYEDPHGRIQGEFSSSQMLAWFLAGRYFTGDLRIRRKCDDTFSTLYNYMQLYGQIPFIGTKQILPIRGGITPHLVQLVRMQEQQNAASIPFACLDQQPSLHKLPRSTTGDGGCGLDASSGFAKNGMSYQNYVAAAASQSMFMKQINEMLSPNSAIFNNPVLTFLMEYISKVRTDSQQFQELLNGCGLNGPCQSGSWQQSQQQQVAAQLLAQQLQQLQLPAQQPQDNVFTSSSEISDPMGGGFTNDLSQASETTKPSSSDDTSGVIDRNDHSPKSTRLKSSSAKISDGGTAKSKKSSQSQPQQKRSSMGECNSDGAEGITSNSQQTQRAVSNPGYSTFPVTSGTWSDSLQFNSTSSATVSRLLTSTQEQSQAGGSRPIKNCWTEKPLTAGINKGIGETSKSAKQFSSSLSTSVGTNGKSISAVDSSTTQAQLESNCTTKKKVKSRQQQQTTVQNGTKKSGNAGTSVPSKKSKGSAADHSPMADELNILIRWVQSALAGIELKEKLDIPTLVEVLISIDAPYEVESMLIAYLGNSSRSKQFVREFLDRRHTCWQMHRKRLEEMQNDSHLKQGSNDQQSSSAPTVSEGSTYLTKAYSEANDSTADSVWQQIKPKNCSSRRGKKGGKHRS